MLAQDTLLPAAYIPPFNDYTDDTLRQWVEAGGRYFFGGRNVIDHSLGEYPVEANGVVHVSALDALYTRAPSLCEHSERLLRLARLAVPLVVTLHTVWDANDLPRVGEAVKLMPVACQSGLRRFLAFDS